MVLSFFCFLLGFSEGAWMMFPMAFFMILSIAGFIVLLFFGMSPSSSELERLAWKETYKDKDHNSHELTLKEHMKIIDAGKQ